MTSSRLRAKVYETVREKSVYPLLNRKRQLSMDANRRPEDSNSLEVDVTTPDNICPVVTEDEVKPCVTVDVTGDVKPCVTVEGTTGVTTGVAMVDDMGTDGPVEEVMGTGMEPKTSYSLSTSEQSRLLDTIVSEITAQSMAKSERAKRAPDPAAPAPRKRGRPKGSTTKNRRVKSFPGPARPITNAMDLLGLGMASPQRPILPATVIPMDQQHLDLLLQQQLLTEGGGHDILQQSAVQQLVALQQLQALQEQLVASKSFNLLSQQVDTNSKDFEKMLKPQLLTEAIQPAPAARDLETLMKELAGGSHITPACTAPICLTTPVLQHQTVTSSPHTPLLTVPCSQPNLSSTNSIPLVPAPKPSVKSDDPNTQLITALLSQLLANGYPQPEPTIPHQQSVLRTVNVRPTPPAEPSPPKLATTQKTPSQAMSELEKLISSFTPTPIKEASPVEASQDNFGKKVSDLEALITSLKSSSPAKAHNADVAEETGAAAAHPHGNSFLSVGLDQLLPKARGRPYGSTNNKNKISASTDGRRNRGRPRKYPDQCYQVVNGKVKYPGAKERKMFYPDEISKPVTGSGSDQEVNGGPCSPVSDKLDSSTQGSPSSNSGEPVTIAPKPSTATPTRGKRGRPKGSKNRPVLITSPYQLLQLQPHQTPPSQNGAWPELKQSQVSAVLAGLNQKILRQTPFSV